MSQKSARHYATDWVFRHSRVFGLARYIFVAIAQFMRGQKCETPPTSVDEIRAITGLGESTIRRGIQEITEAGDLVVLKDRRRGTVHRYALAREVRLPLDIDPAQRSQRAVSVVRQTDDDVGLSAVTAGGVSGQSERSVAHRSVGPVSAGGALVQQASNSDLSTSYKELRTTTTTAAEAEALLAWLRHEYPRRNGGALFTFETAPALQILGSLLADRPVDRLQAMFVVLWTIERAEDEWCFGSDRSLSVFCHAADRLDRIAVARARLEAPASPIAATVWDDACRHLRAHINRHSFQTWFGAVRLVEDRDGVLILEAPNALTVQWIQKHYADVLQEALNGVRPGTGVIFRTATESEATA